MIRAFISLFIALLFTAYLFSPLKAEAQRETDFLISWQARNYAPPSYLGRLLPARKTILEAAVELTENGRLVNLSGNEIRWFFDGQLQKSGIGMKTVFFVIPDFIPAGDHELEVTVIGFRGRNLEKKIELPIVEPEVVIDAPYVHGKIAAGLNNFYALPYYFNISRPIQLIFNWAANNQSITEAGGGSDLLTLDTSTGRSGQPISLRLEALSKINQLEVASRLINLAINKL